MTFALGLLLGILSTRWVQRRQEKAIGYDRRRDVLWQVEAMRLELLNFYKNLEEKREEQIHSAP